MTDKEIETVAHIKAMLATPAALGIPRVGTIGLFPETIETLLALIDRNDNQIG